MQKIFLAVIVGIILFGGGFTVGHFFNSPDAESLIFLETEEVEDDSLLTDSTAVADLDIVIFDQVWRTAEAKFIDAEKLNSKEMFYGAM
jgi:hypothetical protein